MAINLADNIRVGQQKPIDDKYFNGLSPYTNVAQAKSLILSAVRHRGLTVNVAGVEWWWKDGILDAQLVVKTVDLSGYVPFTGSTTNVVLGGQLTTPQINFASSYINGNGEVINLSATGGVNPTHAFFDKGLRFYNGAAYVDIKSDNITGNQSIQVPNASGTLALTTDCQAPLSGTGIVKSASGAISYINGAASQYVRGDGTLASFPTSTGGGASVSYYLNGSVSQGTIGGVAYKEMNSVPIIGTGTDFSINADGYIAQFITDVGDPNKLQIPAGNWNFEAYFNSSSNGGSPRFYIELYKYDGTTFTLIASNSATPEYITGGTVIDLYFTALAVPATTLLATDRLAVRFYVIHSSKTITMHTEGNHLSQIITTFSTGLTALNGLSAQAQYFQIGLLGADFNIVSTTDTHVFNLPIASATNTGKLLNTDWSEFKAKLPIQAGVTTGVAISFLTDRVYGSIATPETGNITANVTGGQIGVTNIIIHSSGTAPTFGSEFKKLSGSGNYLLANINYIFCTYITSTEIIYAINQRT